MCSKFLTTYLLNFDFQICNRRDFFPKRYKNIMQLRYIDQNILKCTFYRCKYYTCKNKMFGISCFFSDSLFDLVLEWKEGLWGVLLFVACPLRPLGDDLYLLSSTSDHSARDGPPSWRPGDVGEHDFEVGEDGSALGLHLGQLTPRHLGVGRHFVALAVVLVTGQHDRRVVSSTLCLRRVVSRQVEVQRVCAAVQAAIVTSLDEFTF